MSMFVASLLFILLFAVAIAHFSWAFGRSWPIRDPATLAATVIGVPGVTSVPRLPAFGVAIGVMVAALFGLALADHDSGGIWLDIAGFAIAFVFLARGIVGYTAWWRGRTPLEPFRTLDRRNYSPLCLILGAGFIVLVVLRLI
jgi:hypothetical protein